MLGMESKIISFQEEDEDEELLKLRLAALSSAYTRNIDIAKESSVSDGKADEPSLNAEDNKSRKKKSKQPKEASMFLIITLPVLQYCDSSK